MARKDYVSAHGNGNNYEMSVGHVESEVTPVTEIQPEALSATEPQPEIIPIAEDIEGESQSQPEEIPVEELQFQPEEIPVEEFQPEVIPIMEDDEIVEDDEFQPQDDKPQSQSESDDEPHFEARIDKFEEVLLLKRKLGNPVSMGKSNKDVDIESEILAEVNDLTMKIFNLASAANKLSAKLMAIQEATKADDGGEKIVRKWIYLDKDGKEQIVDTPGEAFGAADDPKTVKPIYAFELKDGGCRRPTREELTKLFGC